MCWLRGEQINGDVGDFMMGRGRGFNMWGEFGQMLEFIELLEVLVGVVGEVVKEWFEVLGFLSVSEGFVWE